ncbi:MAG TPA: LLM class flavin-dependent oxidoreductase [Baekduia sp.]|nr:LLM class flavin-dependent oxidoreductase [Baekduia sp.]
MKELEFIYSVDMTYPWFPPADDRESIGIDMSNGMYNPDLGKRTLDRVVGNTVFAEQLGYDGVLIFEQHNHPLALFGNAIQGATWLAAKTDKIMVAGVGPIINAYKTPVRLAEEIALLDNFSNGRLIVGLPMGIGAQYHSLGVMNPAHARAIQREAVELLYRIWTEDGPFAWEGEYFHIPYVNVWPKTLRKPHPEVFIPAAGSRESLDMAAKFRFTYQAIAVPMPVLLRNIDTFRELCEGYGYTPEPRQITAVLSVHTAETDDLARAEIEKHTLWEKQTFFRFPFEESFPPGHVSMGSLRGMMAGGYRSSPPWKLTWDELIAGDSLVAGSPETVRQRLTEITDKMGSGRVIIADSFTQPDWLQRKSMALFAEEVMPHFRTDGKAVWQREESLLAETSAESAARSPQPAGRPVVDMPEGRVDLYTQPGEHL